MEQKNLIAKNITTNTDSYKLTHWNMLPPLTQYVYSYWQSRIKALYNKTAYVGLQFFAKEYLVGKVVTEEFIQQGKELCLEHFGSDQYNEKMWRHILEKHDGKLPLRIRAVPEGCSVDVDNVMMTVENTDPKCAPLTNHCETLLSNLWGPCTISSLSREVKILCGHYLKETSDNPAWINFMLHDFGARGVMEPHVAAVGGMGHIVNFLGTDTVVAMECARDYYGASLKGLAYSVPASEHSIMTALGPEGEFKMFEMLLDRFPKGILSVVIDSYDYRRFINVYARKLKDKILARDGKVVFRPDSGDPDSTTMEVLRLLDSVFGSTKNSKGYLTLNPKVGTLWGDGIEYAGIRSILYTMRSQGWACDNILFGMGGGLLQKLNRDTQRFAFKSSAQCRDGVWYDVWKAPLDSTKASKRGRLKLIKENGFYHTVLEGERPELPDEMVTVFENGELVKEWTFSEIRARALADLPVV